MPVTATKGVGVGIGVGVGVGISLGSGVGVDGSEQLPIINASMRKIILKIRLFFFFILVIRLVRQPRRLTTLVIEQVCIFSG
jgi:hypothetical protein